MTDVSATAESHRDRPISVPDTIHIFHVFPTFGVGGVQVRMTNVINHLGRAFRHTILALDGDDACKDRLSTDLPITFLPPLAGQRGLIRDLSGIRKTLQWLRPDLLLTYNWGAIEWAFANVLSPISRHIHLESGFGLEEADRQFVRRILFRRIALARTWRLIVPSETLVRIARRDWKLASEMVSLIPDGIDCVRFGASPDPMKRPDFSPSSNQLVVGAIGPLRPEKNLGFLIEAFAAMTSRLNIRLVIVGRGSERAQLEQRAQELGITEKVTFTGHLDAVEQALPWFDILALTSRTEQTPNSVLQAMAAGKPIVAVDVGDVSLMLSPENRQFVTPKNDKEAFIQALEQMLGNADVRVRVGARNQAHVREHYSQERMFDAYRELLTTAAAETNSQGTGAASTIRAASGSDG